MKAKKSKYTPEQDKALAELLEANERLAKPQHTPTPWTDHKKSLFPQSDGIIWGPDGIGICEMQRMGYPEEMKANAAFIVRAVNAHEDMLAALKNLVERNLIKDVDGDHHQEVLDSIAKAEGK